MIAGDHGFVKIRVAFLFCAGDALLGTAHPSNRCTCFGIFTRAHQAATHKHSGGASKCRSRRSISRVFKASMISFICQWKLGRDHRGVRDGAASHDAVWRLEVIWWFGVSTVHGQAALAVPWASRAEQQLHFMPMRLGGGCSYFPSSENDKHLRVFSWRNGCQTTHHSRWLTLTMIQVMTQTFESS